MHRDMSNTGEESEVESNNSDDQHEKAGDRDVDRNETFKDTRSLIQAAVCFAGFGLVLHCGFFIIVSGAQDILAGTNVPTTALMASHVGPMVLVMTAAPWFMNKISYFIRIMVVFSFISLGLLLIIFVEGVPGKLCGVASYAVAHGLGEVTILALGAFYGEVAISAFAAGSGAGILAGPLYYTGMTVWACVSPMITLMITGIIPLSVLLFYYLLDKDHVKSYQIADTYGHGHYTPLKDAAEQPPRDLSWGEKCASMWQIMPLIVALFVAYVAQYVTIQSVFTTIAFPSAPFHPRDHYVYYVMLNGGGELLGRSYLSLIACISPRTVCKIVFKRTWILSLVQVAVMVFAVCASWFRFIEHVSVIMSLCFVVGALSGIIFVNSVCAVPEVVESRYREFSLGVIAIGESLGTLAASLIGFFVEPRLRQNCRSRTLQKSQCFTRYGKSQWTQDMCIKKVR